MSEAIGKAAMKDAAATENPIRKAQHLKKAQLAFAMDAAASGSESSIRKSIAAARAVDSTADKAPPEKTGKAATLTQAHGLRHGRPVHHSPSK